MKAMKLQLCKPMEYEAVLPVFRVTFIYIKGIECRLHVYKIEH